MSSFYWITTIKAANHSLGGQLSYLGNTLAVGTYNFQFCIASASIAAATASSRYAVVLSLFQFIALALGTLMSFLGSQVLHLHTDAYFRVAAVTEAGLALLILALGGGLALLTSDVDDAGKSTSESLHSDHTALDVEYRLMPSGTRPDPCTCRSIDTYTSE